MDRFEIVLEHRAERELWRLPLHVRQAFHDAFRRLEDDPFTDRPRTDIRRLADTSGFGLRVGAYRALYHVDRSRRLVIITKVAHRRNVYGR